MESLVLVISLNEWWFFFLFLFFSDVDLIKDSCSSYLTLRPYPIFASFTDNYELFSYSMAGMCKPKAPPKGCVAQEELTLKVFDTALKNSYNQTGETIMMCYYSYMMTEKFEMGTRCWFFFVEGISVIRDWHLHFPGFLVCAPASIPTLNESCACWWIWIKQHLNENSSYVVDIEHWV